MVQSNVCTRAKVSAFLYCYSKRRHDCKANLVQAMRDFYGVAVCISAKYSELQSLKFQILYSTERIEILRLLINMNFNLCGSKLKMMITISFPKINFLFSAFLQKTIFECTVSCLLNQKLASDLFV